MTASAASAASRSASLAACSAASAADRTTASISSDAASGDADVEVGVVTGAGSGRSRARGRVHVRRGGGRGEVADRRGGGRGEAPAGAEGAAVGNRRWPSSRAGWTRGGRRARRGVEWKVLARRGVPTNGRNNFIPPPSLGIRLPRRRAAAGPRRPDGAVGRVGVAFGGGRRFGPRARSLPRVPVGRRVAMFPAGLGGGAERRAPGRG